MILSTSILYVDCLTAHEHAGAESSFTAIGQSDKWFSSIARSRGRSGSAGCVVALRIHCCEVDRHRARVDCAAVILEPGSNER